MRVYDQRDGCKCSMVRGLIGEGIDLLRRPLMLIYFACYTHRYTANKRVTFKYEMVSIMLGGGWLYAHNYSCTIIVEDEDTWVVEYSCSFVIKLGLWWLVLPEL